MKKRIYFLKIKKNRERKEKRGIVNISLREEDKSYQLIKNFFIYIFFLREKKITKNTLQPWERVKLIVQFKYIQVRRFTLHARWWTWNRS